MASLPEERCQLPCVCGADLSACAR